MSESLEPSSPIPDIWGHVPPRNKNFTGRKRLLAELGEHLVSKPTAAVLPEALHGMGGVGKTQLAIEYAHMHAGQYQVVWWVPAYQIALVRSSLAALAPRLGLTGIAQGRVDEAASAVLDALRRGKPYSRWLLIFDNADKPESVREFIPPGPGHVIITSRNRDWAEKVDALEVDVFARDESREYMGRRVPGIAAEDANRLAEELGDLPLALEQAAALLAQPVITVDDYLELLAEESSKVFAELPRDSDYELPVAAAWSLSVTKLKEEAPYALELLQRFAFFGPAPISLELVDRGRYVLGPPLKNTLRDRLLLDRAVRALGRFSLARVDNVRRTLEVHRIIQKLIRDELDPEVRVVMSHEVHLLLAASDPDNPDDIAQWPVYSDLLAHAGPANIVECPSEEVRRLVQNLVRYLWVTGSYTDALALANEALTRWVEDSPAGANDKYVLIMNRLKTQILRALGRYEDSHDLAVETLARMRQVLGEDHEETLILINGYCVDLRARGEFQASLELTTNSLERHKAVFGDSHPRTLAAMNNLAEDFELNADYPAAYKLNEELYRDKEMVYNDKGHPLVLLTLNARARIMREQGYYNEARPISQQAYDGYQDLVRRRVLGENHVLVLQQAVDHSAALRAAGYDSDSLKVAQYAYDGYKFTFGPDHADTLAAVGGLGNAHRLGGDMSQAWKLMSTAVEKYQSIFGSDHPYTLCTSVNLSIINQRLGEVGLARRRLEETQERLNRSMGPDKHPSFLCGVNLATAMAKLGDVEAAAKLGEEMLQRLTRLLGEGHPNTLTCAANLALDWRALGKDGQAAELTKDTLERYRRRLGDEHPEVRAVESGQRQDLGIELPVLF